MTLATKLQKNTYDLELSLDEEANTIRYSTKLKRVTQLLQIHVSNITLQTYTYKMKGILDLDA